ncbi:type III-A CRISPR-associated RAMP protein Csm3 [Jhaorihella thermophila]
MEAAEKTVDAYIGQALVTGTLVVDTGLHIGAGKDEIEIGGIDNPVVKTPQGDPYVPGSSIKGKMRFLMEWAFGKVRANGDGKVWGWSDEDVAPGDPILRIFGTAAKKRTPGWKARRGFWFVMRCSTPRGGNRPCPRGES